MWNRNRNETLSLTSDSTLRNQSSLWNSIPFFFFFFFFFDWSVTGFCRHGYYTQAPSGLNCLNSKAGKKDWWRWWSWLPMAVFSSCHWELKLNRYFRSHLFSRCLLKQDIITGAFVGRIAVFVGCQTADVICRKGQFYCCIVWVLSLEKFQACRLSS